MTNNGYYNLNELIYLENEKGDYIELCNPNNTDDIEGSNKYGIKPSKTYSSVQLQGYAVHKKMSVVALGNNKFSSVTEYRAYLNAKTFNPSMINSDTLLGVNGVYYQMEQTEDIMYRGTVIYYGFSLNETVKIKEKIRITDKKKIKRKYPFL